MRMKFKLKWHKVPAIEGGQLPGKKVNPMIAKVKAHRMLD